MRIALFHNTPSGGAKRAIYEWTRRLATNHEIDVYTLSSADHAFCDIRPFVQRHHIFDFTPRRLFNSPWGNRGLFKALSHAIQFMVVHGREPYPAERTLLTTGALEAAMRCYQRGGGLVNTPHLQIPYRTTDWSRMRETGETWKIITADVPQPVRFSPRPFEPLKRGR